MGGKLGKSLEAYADVGTLCLRIAIGVIFLAHGSQKLFGWFGGPGLAAMGDAFSQMGFQPGLFWAAVAGASEFFGGLTVLLGFATHVGAFLIGMVMLVAMLKVHLPNGFFLNFMCTPGVGHGIEYNVALLGGCVALLLGGPGKYSVECASCKE